jgi:cytosine deaminase
MGDNRLQPGDRADIVLLDAENVMDALVRMPSRELVVGAGRVLFAA